MYGSRVDWSTQEDYTTKHLTERLKHANLLRSAVLFPGTQGVMALGGPPAFLSSSSLSDPPEELLSEATRGAFPPAPEDAPTSSDTKTEKMSLLCLSNQFSWYSGSELSSKNAGEHSPLFLWFCLACLSTSLLPESTGELHLGSVSVL